ncbi:MAG: ATP synthase F0 subunit C [Candidatus Gracilibacteria bacterium]
MELNLQAIGVVFSIGLTGIGASLGQLLLTRMAMDTLGKNPKIGKEILIQTTVGITLIESIVIFGLLVAFKILNTTGIDYVTAIAAGLSIGLTGFIVGLGEGKLMATSIESLNRNPENKNQVLMFMILFAALLESVVIFGLLVSLSLLK